MQDSKFLGLCILAASVIVGAAIVAASIVNKVLPTATPIGRFQFQPSTPPGVIWVIDTTTGDVKSRSG